MKKGFRCFSSAIAAVLLIAAVQTAGARARSVSPEDRLSISQPRYSGTWKGNDLSVVYSYSTNQGQMTLSGRVEFSYSMVMGYVILEDFRLSAVLLDENGIVLEEIGLATEHDGFDPIPFNRQISLPPKAAYIAFGYQGIAVDAGKSGQGRTSFWHDPVRN
ncbi:conserved exported hypothetical protein [Syntrophobacter sp. SbD1]|nr:conserved exported hypothetical protein [Syntrophobacter sp. SbD1]